MPDPDTETLAKVLAAHLPVDNMGGAWCKCGWKRSGTGLPSRQWAEHAARIVQARAGESALREELLAEVERDLLNLSWSDVARFAIVKVIRNVRDRHDVALATADPS